MFQGVKATRPGVKKLVETLNAKLPNPLESPDLNATFDRWYDDLAACIAAIPTVPSSSSARKPEEILDEISVCSRATSLTCSRVGRWESAPRLTKPREPHTVCGS
jgi:hypothetical protein